MTHWKWQAAAVFIMFICILSLIHQIIDLQIGLDILNGSYYLYHHK